MPALLVIPARYASSRFPGKPLMPLTGATGDARPLIRRSWEAAQQVQGIDRIVIATDDPRIATVCEGFGAEVALTAPTHKNGTERCGEVAEMLDGYDVIVNFQGDAPLTPPWFVEALLTAMEDLAISVATPVLRCDAATLAGLQADRRAGRVGGTTAVFDKGGRALYFSKEVLPYTGSHSDGAVPVFHHVGVYAYRRAALRAYAGWAEGALERAEGLEQLRFLENGTPVQCVEVDARSRCFWELNNPEDVPVIEGILADQGMP